MIVKVMDVGTSFQRFKAYLDFRHETGVDPTVYITRKTFFSYISQFAFEPEYDDDEQWVDGVKYMLASRFLYGNNEIALSDNVLVLTQ